MSGDTEMSVRTNHLNSVAMLVDFSASQWTARKVDKAKSAELNESHHANEKASHVSKKLVMADTLQKIATLVTRARDRHKELTSPWLDNGARILSVANNRLYFSDMEKFEAEFWPLVDRACREFPQWIEDASREHVALGRLFNINDYPKASRIRDKFGWRQSTFALPDAADFRVDIGATQVARIKADIEKTVSNAAANAVRDVFERVHERVAAMVEKLTAYKPATDGGKTEGIFRDSLVENVRELVALMPGLNFTNDARITKLAADMSALVAHDAETLRESDNIRASVAAKAADIVQAVSDFMA